MERKELLRAIQPAVAPPDSDKFSRNLYNWVRCKGKWPYDRVICAQVDFKGSLAPRSFNYEHGRSDLFLGHMIDGLTTGAQIMRILTGDPRIGCYVNREFNPVDVTDWFWEEYLRLGRCFLHPSHEDWLRNGDERWEYSDDEKRICRWCGHEQSLVTEVKTERVWRSAA